MPADTEPEYAQNRSRTVNGSKLNVSGAARLAGRTTPSPPTAPDHREADMQRTEPPPGDEWTCEGQADLLDELEALS
jgi:hypothetical protein